jgi:hypothetical protein
MGTGFAVICPHLNSRRFSGICDEEWFLEGYREILTRCDAAFLLEGWQDSEGSRAEDELAGRICIPVFQSIEDVKKYFKLEGISKVEA